jgi:hypothetical protein
MSNTEGNTKKNHSVFTSQKNNECSDDATKAIGPLLFL